ncbi:hypothetical protein PMPD1_4438 (plasmid) [Paramixta manurensis]|uniref:Cytoplasmic protein n=1 Tax=Paramixta manurensis TaxID=2740817 RepID=A0A6M8UEQ2_9GAMM|nr:hypothetical protein PMPD1_4438 [Erwiniaceae bacterium PD-1]
MDGGSPLDQARDNFYRNHSYTLGDLEQDYRTELLRYSNDAWEAPQRAARLSAAVKRYKTYQMLCFIFDIAEESGLDFTPLVVKRVCAHLFGRQGSQKLIVDIFGRKGRENRSPDSAPSVTESTAGKYQQAADAHWQRTMKDIEKVKRDYQTAISASKKPENA